MPDPFFDELEKAYHTVMAHPEARVTIERGDKQANVFNKDGAVFIRISFVELERATDSLRADLTKLEKENV